MRIPKRQQPAEEQQAAVFSFCSPLKYNKSTRATTNNVQQGQTNKRATKAHKSGEGDRHHDFLAPLHHCHLELWVIGFSHTRLVQSGGQTPPSPHPFRPASFCNILSTSELLKTQ